MVESNIFVGYRVRMHPPTIISHLQFVDDTLILGVKSWVNIKAMCVVFVIFEAMSCLKVNFHKNIMVGINTNDIWFNEAS